MNGLSRTWGAADNTQTQLTELVVYVKKNPLPTINQVLSDAPCLTCPESLAPACDVNGCPKLTAWLTGEHP